VQVKVGFSGVQQVQPPLTADVFALTGVEVKKAITVQLSAPSHILSRKRGKLCHLTVKEGGAIPPQFITNRWELPHNLFAFKFENIECLQIWLSLEKRMLAPLHPTFVNTHHSSFSKGRSVFGRWEVNE
jgi:hypothetical protein